MPKYNIDVSFDITLDCANEDEARRIGEKKVDEVSGNWHDPFGADWGSFVAVENKENK